MTSSRSRGPATYALRVAAQLDDRWADWFDGFALTRENDGTTTLSGSVADQAQLHGLLAKVRDLGLDLVSVEVQAGKAGRWHTMLRAHQRDASRLGPPARRGPAQPPQNTARKAPVFPGVCS